MFVKLLTFLRGIVPVLHARVVVQVGSHRHSSGAWLERIRPARSLLALLDRIAPAAKPAVQKTLIRAGYNFLSSRIRGDETDFLNYGYVSPDPSVPPLALEAEDEPQRYFIQLYWHVAGAVDLRDKDVLEVGCGRGGGSSFMRRYLHPRSVTGVDLSSTAIKYCQSRYRIDDLHFREGDAEDLPLPAESFDVVVNVESSHCYPSVERFFREVYRVLRPGGHFLFADIRGEGDINQVLAQLRTAGFTVTSEARITEGVVRALDLDSERREAFTEAHIPTFLRTAFTEFAGVRGSQIYESFRSGSVEYVRIVLRKPELPSQSGEKL